MYVIVSIKYQTATGKEIEDFVAGKGPSNYSRKARRETIKVGKPIRHELFEVLKFKFDILMREDWNAKEPLHEDEYFELQADVLVNFTDTEECNNVHECIKAVQTLQAAHMAAGEPDIRQKCVADLT